MAAQARAGRVQEEDAQKGQELPAGAAGVRRLLCITYYIVDSISYVILYYVYIYIYIYIYTHIGPLTIVESSHCINLELQT